MVSLPRHWCTEQVGWQLLPAIYFGDGRKAFGSVGAIKGRAKPLASPAFPDRAKPWKVGLHLGLTTSAKVTQFLGPDVSKLAPRNSQDSAVRVQQPQQPRAVTFGLQLDLEHPQETLFSDGDERVWTS